MIRIIALSLTFFTFALSAAPVTAQQLIADYYTLLSRTDMYNSRGTRLGDFCAVVQQDRANFHRFGLRDELDGWDSVFGNRNARNAISARCRVERGYGYIPGDVMNGVPRYVYVRVFASGGRITEVFVTEGAG